MPAKFIAEEGPVKGLELPLDNGDSWVIGRDPEFCQLLIEDPSVSRQHALCKRSEEGIFLENLSTTNKTFVNDEEITSPYLLQNSDFLKIGNGSYRFYEEIDKDELENENNEIEQSTNDMKSDEKDKEIENESIQDPEDAKNELKEKLENENNEIEQSTNDMKSDEEDKEIENESIQDPEDAKNEPEEKLENENNEIEHSTNHMKTYEKDKETENKLIKEPEGKLENEVEDEDDSIFEEESSSSGDLAQINFDYSETGRFLLKVISGVNNGAEFPMQEDHSYLVGTDPAGCDIIFNDNSVSRQHAKISINPENTIFIEDLNSRNGTLVDGESIKEKKEIDQNALITIGTTSFVIYDRESAMQTVISPLMPSIVKILQQKEEAKRREEQEKAEEKALALEQAELSPEADLKHEIKSNRNTSAFILTATITGLFVIAGIATTTLFKSEPVVTEQNIDVEASLAKALEPFPSIKYNFNKSTGMLLLAGHVLSLTDRNQLLYNLQGLKFIKNIDDAGVIIDELAWREINPTLSKNPAWRSVSIQSPSPGKFILSGYLKTRKEAEQLWDYVSNNFAYINLLEKKIVVEEDVISNVNSMLMNEGFKDVTVQMNQGELTLTGFIPTGKEQILATLIADFNKIPGIRNVNNYVAELAVDQSMINLTDRYDVTGYSHQGKGNLSVVINGRILIRGDVLDGMLITSIKPNAIFLEKDGVKYRIDYNQ